MHLIGCRMANSKLSLLLILAALSLNKEPDEAQVYLDKAKGYFLQTGNRSRLMPILGTQASIAMIKGNRDAALALFRETYAIARELGNPFEEAASAYGIGQVLAERESHESHDKLIRALELFRSLGERLYEFRCLALLGQIAYASTDYREVVRLLSQAISLAQVVTIEPAELIQGLGRLGGAQVSIGALTEAKNTYEWGLQLAKEVHDRIWEGHFAGNLGAVYVESEHPEEAQLLLEEALSIAEASNDADGIAIAHSNLSRLKNLYPASYVTHRNKQHRSSLTNSTKHASQLGRTAKDRTRIIRLASSNWCP